MAVNVTCTIEQISQTFYETHVACWLAPDSLYLQFKPTIWALKITHTNTPTALLDSRTSFFDPSSHSEKHRLYWKCATLP